MARDENNPTIIGVTQYLDPSYWRWASSDPRGSVLLTQGAEVILEHLVGLLEVANCSVVEAYAIIHDKDEREVWSDTQLALVVEPKPVHIHVVIKFASRAKSASLSRLGDLLGVEPQYVEKPGRGGFAYDNMLSYLTHAKYADKYQYDPSEVATVRGPTYRGIDASRRDAWLKGRAHVKKKRVTEEFEAFLEQVLQGEVTRDQIMLTDEYFDICSRYAREVDDALAAYGQRRAYRAAAKLRAGEFSTQVIFVHGQAGVGKTRFANCFIEAAVASAFEHGHRWQLYRAATMNPLDDWRGEEVLLLDDLRASSMDANDWLLLLDPHNASPARARYRNKGEVAPRLIVITATIDPVEFFFYARKKGEVDEALDQFIRRLASIVVVFREDDVLRYRVQRVGRVAPYRREIETGDRRFGSPRAYVELAQGVVSTTAHTANGAIATLLTETARHNRDVPFATSSGWPALEMLVTDEENESRIAQLEAELAALDATKGLDETVPSGVLDGLLERARNDGRLTEGRSRPGDDESRLRHEVDDGDAS